MAFSAFRHTPVSLPVVARRRSTSMTSQASWWVGLGAFSVFWLLLTSLAAAAPVTIAWNGVPQATGYKVYYGTASRVYSMEIDVGNSTTAALSLDPSEVYYITTTAYDNAGDESTFSNEVVYNPAQPNVLAAVNAGGNAYTAANATVYQADTQFTGGDTYTTSAKITGTVDQVLYQSERYGDFSYAFPLANGYYLVTLKFAEIYWTQVGQRVFNVLLQGSKVLSKLDIVAKVGPNAAYDVTLPVRVNGGTLTIAFQSVVDYAKVSAILVTPAQTMFAVNAGGPQYAAANGTVYQADTQFTGGNTYTTTAKITNTANQPLYRSERYGNFSYTIPLANGSYLVTLKFAEIYWTQVGQRVFNVLAQGTKVVSNLDLVAKVGPNAAYDVTSRVYVTNGQLTLTFQSVVDNAKVSAILITGQGTLP
jgi:Malectin domain